MPIHFRCGHCNLLLGIARRKAGTVVNCPSCSGQVIVPKELPPQPSGQDQPPSQSEDLLERSDFEAMLKPPAPGRPVSVPARRDAPTAPVSPARQANPPGALPVASPLQLPAPRPNRPNSALDVEAVDEPVLVEDVRLLAPANLPSAALPLPPQGILLSPAKATVLTVAVILLIAVAFIVGLLIGRYSAQQKAKSALQWEWRAARENGPVRLAAEAESLEAVQQAVEGGPVEAAGADLRQFPAFVIDELKAARRDGGHFHVRQHVRIEEGRTQGQAKRPTGGPQGADAIGGARGALGARQRSFGADHETAPRDEVRLIHADCTVSESSAEALRFFALLGSSVSVLC